MKEEGKRGKNRGRHRGAGPPHLPLEPHFSFSFFTCSRLSPVLSLTPKYAKTSSTVFVCAFSMVGAGSGKWSLASSSSSSSAAECPLLSPSLSPPPPPCYHHRPPPNTEPASLFPEEKKKLKKKKGKTDGRKKKAPAPLPPHTPSEGAGPPLQRGNSRTPERERAAEESGEARTRGRCLLRGRPAEGDVGTARHASPRSPLEKKGKGAAEEGLRSVLTQTARHGSSCPPLPRPARLLPPARSGRAPAAAALM